MLKNKTPAAALSAAQKAALMGALALAPLGAAWAAEPQAGTPKAFELPHCEKPVASVMVGKLHCKAAACQPAPKTDHPLAAIMRAQQQGPDLSAAGEGMAAMLTTLLKETGCFEIQDREALEEMARELAMVGKTVQVQQANFMISGAITSIGLATERSSIGGGLIPVIGAISTTKQTAELALDVKVLDVNRARVVEAKTFQSNNASSSVTLGGLGASRGVLMGGAFQSIKGTPMEGVVRHVLAQVASFTATRLLESGAAPSITAPAVHGPSAPASGADEQQAVPSAAAPGPL